MRLSQKAKTALARVVEQFRAGDLSSMVRIIRLERQGEPLPFDRWSLSNRILAYIQTGSTDLRGYRQWQRVGRHVRKGSRAAFILAPCTAKVTDEKTGEVVQVLRGFRSVPVFPFEATVGDPLPVYDLTPRDLPPLTDVARRLGVSVEWRVLPADRLGSYAIDGSRIRLGTQDPAVFFHELAHAAHSRINGKLTPGQTVEQETTAEFTAAVLMHLYGLGDRTGNAWRYIEGYSKEPLVAIQRALNTVEKVLALLLGGPAQNGEVQPHVT